MAIFKFELEHVLRQRKNVEQVAQRDVALAVQAMAAIENQLKRLDEGVRAVTDDVRSNHLVGALDVSFITAHRRYLRSMERAAVDLARQIGEAKAKVDKAQMLLVEAAKQRKTIEKLRERQHERWQTNQTNKENAAGDEAGMQIAFNNIVENRA